MVFLDSLRVMGLGMVGIFAVTLILIAVMKLLTKVFPSDGEKEEKAE